MSRHRAAEDTVAELQTEHQILRTQLRYLQHHLSLSRLHARHSNKTEERNPRANSRYQYYRLLEERRKALVASHSSSVRGPHASEYRRLLTAHIRLEDGFRQVAAARVVARYRLQKLIVDAAHYCNAESPAVRRLRCLYKSYRFYCFPLSLLHQHHNTSFSGL